MKCCRFPILSGAGRVFPALLVAVGVWGLVACGGGSSSSNGTGEPGTFVFTSDNMVDAAETGVSAFTTFEGVSEFVVLMVELAGPSQSLEPVSQENRLTPMEITDIPICLDGNATLTSSDFLTPGATAVLSLDGCKIEENGQDYFVLDGDVELAVVAFNPEALPPDPFLVASLTIDVNFDEVLEGRREQGSFVTENLPLRASLGTDSIVFEYGLGEEVLFTAQQTEPSASTIKFGCFEIGIELVVGDGDVYARRVGGSSGVVVDNRAFGVAGGLGFQMFGGEPVPRDGELQYFSELPRECSAIGAGEGITPAPSAMKLFPGQEAPQMVLELYPNGLNQPKTATEEFSWFEID